MVNIWGLGSAFPTAVHVPITVRKQRFPTTPDYFTNLSCSVRWAIPRSFRQFVTDPLPLVLVILLHLRQVCNHPALISGREEDPEAAGRIRAETEATRAVRSFGAKFVARVKAKIRDLKTKRTEVELTVR